MRFITNVLLSLIQSVLVVIILWIAIVSLIQQKFPPTVKNPNEILKTIRTILNATSHFDSKEAFDETFNNGHLITDRRKILEEINQIDPSLKPEPKNKLPSPKDMDGLAIRMQQSEYKIRSLEYEISVLRSELKKIKLISKSSSN